MTFGRVSAIMREAKKVERSRLFSTWFGPFFGEASELQQFRLAWFYFQMKLRQPVCHFAVEPFGIIAILEAGQKVVCVAKVVGLSPAPWPELLFKPHVERVVQVHVGEQW